ncbi:MAG: hypothetical protein AAF250_13025 [Pseudomonadota bacterium]
MALLVLIVIGALLGWVASIITRTEAPREVLRQIVLGLFSALVAGLIVNQGTILGGLSLLALGTAIAAAIAMLVLYHGAFRRSEA